eukprot:2363368-Karenia_brevis.AAC.1
MDPNREFCRARTIQRSQCHKKGHGKPDPLPEPEYFGDSITGDHQILGQKMPLAAGLSCKVKGVSV